MKSPLDLAVWDGYEQVESTQTIAAEHVRNGAPVGVVFANHQNGGRGRFDRLWHSDKGDSLTMSIIMTDYADFAAPHLLGMATACAAASVLHCELQWPNDLVFGDRKVGGILTELVPDSQGRRIPVIGVGVNLNQKAFPEEIADRATSVAMYRGGNYSAEEIGRAILNRFPRLPEPVSWADLRPIWMLFDHTPGKSYRFLDGKEGTAIGVGPDGQLFCAIDGETHSVLAADAIFGGNLAS